MRFLAPTCLKIATCAPLYWALWPLRRIPSERLKQAPIIPKPLTKARPLGTVNKVAGNDVSISFVQPVGLKLGSVVALYDTGRVEKHPLTKKVIVEHRRLVAKAQVLERTGDGWRCRPFWTLPDVELAVGLDAVPQPGESVPDAPPVLTTEGIAGFQAKVQQTVVLRLPITDPEGLPMLFTWQLNDASAGLLSSTTTGDPEVQWTAPATPVKTSLKVTARDHGGNTQSWQVPLEATQLGADWRQRKLVQFGRLGAGGDRAVTRIERGPRGTWWGIDGGGAVVQWSTGWLDQSVLPVYNSLRVRNPAAVVPGFNDILVLDSVTKAVHDGFV